MKKASTGILYIVLALLHFSNVFSQKTNGSTDGITSNELKEHLSFLSSPSLQGRMNGSDGLLLAMDYFRDETASYGLIPAANGSFFQEYPVTVRQYEKSLTKISVTHTGTDSIDIYNPFYEIVPTDITESEIEGEVVFAGYGINSNEYSYNDLEDIDAGGKMVLIMNRAPMSDDGEKCLFNEPELTKVEGLSLKLGSLMKLNAKAILVVMDPKSGSESLDDESPGLAAYLSVKMHLKWKGPGISLSNGTTRVIIVHSDVADALLEGTGFTLTDLQNGIDSTLRPHSFNIEGKRLRLVSEVTENDLTFRNVAAYVEGRDPLLKNEVVVFTAHADHMGMTAKGEIFSGADDNASGCSALLELAEEFSALKKKPLRSILFLWLSGEETGLFGSESYIDNPLFPIDNTVAEINLDMIGRSQSVNDTSPANPMTTEKEVFVISDDQSTELRNIAIETDKKSILSYNYTLSDKNHPLNLYERSDQFSFTQINIPILFFTTGLHTTYHTPDDTIDKIDFGKLELIARDVFRIGYSIANRRKRIIVDNPYSSW